MSALPKLVAFSIALTAAPALVYRAATGGALDALCARLVGPPTHHARLTLAGLGAVVAVNLILLAYVVMAMLEGGGGEGAAPAPAGPVRDKKDA